MANNNGRKRKCPPSPSLGSLHDDMLERVLARLPPASFFRLRAVCRRWRATSSSPTFLAACARVPARDPWFLMLADPDRPSPAVAFVAAERSWTHHCRATAATGSVSVPVAASGGLVLYRASYTGALAVANPLTGASRPLPPPPQQQGDLQAIAMYGGDSGAPYRVALFSGELPHLSMAVFDSSTNSWEGPVALARKPKSDSSDGDSSSPEQDSGDDTVYFLSKSGDVVATNMQRSASKQYSAVAVMTPSSSGDGHVATCCCYFLSSSGTIIACDVARRAFVELPRVLPVYHEYSIDVVACGAAAYAVVLSEHLDTASLRVWEFAGSGGEWRQVAAMPPAMSHGFYGKKADINCVGHGDRLMVCVSSAEANGCFMCDVSSNRWEELPKYVDGDGETTEFLAAFSFEPRLEIDI
ncbi:hypothetical protein PR202_gb20141 [Eleusine coracana subsp. coracana]|uniref:F-box domain-containing protein n=1 Tax=Eleusine coracana subsp. coracana TaxID=191504 RepID=A0AAV5FBU1_ELECO|nr:hypothetical protein PR202_gb20141 [Eleusine coracana subsp. coracana]